MKDAQIVLYKEEYALCMEPRLRSNDAAIMDAKIVLYKEEYALGMEPRAKVKVKRNQCSNEGCTNRALQGGMCIRHGADVKRW